MNTSGYFFIYCILASFLIFSCNPDEGTRVPTAREEVTDALINDGKNWTAAGGTITQDGDDVTDSFVDFRLSFTGTAYTASGGGDVWPDAVNAPWIFPGNDAEDASTIVRQDQVEVQINVTKGQQLTLSFTVLPAGAGGRSSGLDGEYFFDLQSGE